jgi:hypothetical protein
MRSVVIILYASLQLTRDSLVLRFVKDQFDDYRESTIGGMYHLKTSFLLLSSGPHSCVLDTNSYFRGPDNCQV